MFPEATYINWWRGDSILGEHLTDDLSDFGVPYDRTNDVRERRAISWKYQSKSCGHAQAQKWTTVR
jgi:hypothetical protein